MEELALRLRRQWGIDDFAPIDIYSLVLNKIDNLTLAWLDIESSLSGCALEYNGDSLIIINSKHSKGRKNFTLAHELYHLMFEKSNSQYCKNNSEDPVEKRANQFASYFLMPKCALENYCYINNIREWTLRDIVKCEQLFQISHKAMLTRLQEDGYLDEASVKNFSSPKVRIKKYAASSGFDTSLYETSPKSKQNYVLGSVIPLANELYRNDEISKDYRNEIFLKLFREDLLDIGGDNHYRMKRNSLAHKSDNYHVK